ncbi:transposase [Streptomyces sp. NPDC002870]|uniref:transposase n=1 Tax=Streptomyces sp. NPDC002870 TaxID=3364666 RepID=UPI00368D332F
MSKRIGLYPRVRVEGGGGGVVSQAGAVLLVETVRKSGLDTAISAALAPWRKPRTVHDPGKALLDVALATAMGGDCLADVAMLRAEPDMLGPVASDPTVSRLVGALAASGPKALMANRSARAEVRTRVWELAGECSPAAGSSVDIDGVLVLARSEKQDATATWKKTFGHHPLVAFSITVRQDPKIKAAIAAIPDNAWTPIPYWLSTPEVSGADVAEITYTCFAHTKPPVTVRLIVRRVRPTPGSQLALFTTYDHHAFVTDRVGDVTELEADHRRHAVVEQTIAELKSAGLAHLPSGRFTANAAWLALAAMAHNLGRAVGILAGHGLTRATTATLQRTLFTIPGRLVHTARRLRLRLPARWPWADAFTHALTAITALPRHG